MISKGNVSRETFLFDLWNWTNTCDTLQIMKKIHRSGEMSGAGSLFQEE